MSVASGLAIGSVATPELAASAVAQAMQRADISHANSVLLFLSSEFAHDPQPALLAASRQSQCMQIVGCSAAGIFTEHDWGAGFARRSRNGIRRQFEPERSAQPGCR